MSGPDERFADVGGHAIRIWEAGAGPVIGYLAGTDGLLRWSPFLEGLSQSRKVVVPSLPGFPGGGAGHRDLDTLLDWLIATRDVLEAAGLLGGDLIATSVAAPLAADVAAIWPGAIRRLILISPFGYSDPSDAITDIWAQRPGDISGLLSSDPERHAAARRAPADTDPIEWKITLTRGDEAAARYLYPFGDTGLINRLARLSVPLLVVRGALDRTVPLVSAQRIAAAGGGSAQLVEVAGAGHLAELDAPDLVIEAVKRFLVANSVT
jgi:pimeloyl-ACP methyl ester carboxylesterase